MDAAAAEDASDPSAVIASGPALNPVAGPQVGKPSSILLNICPDAGAGPLDVEVDAPLLPRPLEILDHGDGTMSVAFTPLVDGPHIFRITWGKKPIPGSPFRVVVTGTPHRDPSLIVVDTATLARGGIVGQELRFSVIAPEAAGPGPLQVDISGPDEPSTVRVHYVESGRFEAEVKVSAPGQYQIGVLWGDSQPVPGSPFPVEFWFPGEAPNPGPCPAPISRSIPSAPTASACGPDTAAGAPARRPSLQKPKPKSTPAIPSLATKAVASKAKQQPTSSTTARAAPSHAKPVGSAPLSARPSATSRSTTRAAASGVTS
eukprot:RCo043987